MLYCSKCGRKLEEKDVFCPGCGNRTHKTSSNGNAAQPGGNTQADKKDNTTKTQQVDPSKVQYVYVNKKTGKITNNPHVKTKSEGCMQYVAIAFAAIALVFVMVSGTVLLSNYLSDDSGIVNQDDPWEFPSQEVSTAEPVSETSSEPVSSEIVSSESVSSEIVSSESVSSEPSVEEELTARYLNKKIKGKWKTDIPYKNMSLPGTFEFDGKGKVKCTIKAFLFSKKFDGSYTIKDGGRCSLTLDGLEEYFEDDTMVGDLKFVTDDKIEFTVDNTVWKLNRVE